LRRLIRAAPKIGFGLLVLFVLAAIPWTYFNVKYGRELEAELARIKAAGEPLTLTEAAPESVSDDQNAAVLYERVFKVAHMWREERWEPGADRPPMAFNDIEAEGYKALKAYIEGERGESARISRDTLRLPRVQQRLSILREASRRRYAVFPVNWEDGAGAVFPHMVKFRQATYFVTARALLTWAEGDVDAALEWCKVALRMSEQAASEPSAIGQLVSVAMQAIALKGAEQMLSEAAPSLVAAAELERYVATIDLTKSYLQAMRAERTFGLWVFDQIRGKPRAIEQLFDGQHSWLELLWFRIYASALGSPWRKFDQFAYLRHMGQQIEAVHEPYREGRFALATIEDSIHDLPKTAVLSRRLYPVFSRALQKRDGAIARLDEFRIVLALKAYKQQHGPYPETLDELQRTLPWELPKDVFSGEAFRYQRKGEGFMLYSFGRDLDDDGGVREEDRKYQDGDIVWECLK